MALSLNISVTTLTSGGFTFSETTGAYTSPNNEGGWGIPNPTIAQATVATLDVYVPDPNTLLPVNTPVSINMFTQSPSYPQSNTTNSQLITPQDIGYAVGETTPDGVYQFVYTVTANGVDYHKTQYVLVYSAAQCCVSKLAVQAINEGGGCGCGSGCGESMTDFEKGMLLIEAAKYSMICGVTTPAANAIKHVNEICGGCSTC
jgi:hypothetical protein